MTREAIKFPVYWPPPAIIASNYIEWFSWGSGEVKIRLGCEKSLSFLAHALLTIMFTSSYGVLVLLKWHELA